MNTLGLSLSRGRTQSVPDEGVRNTSQSWGQALADEFDEFDDFELMVFLDLSNSHKLLSKAVFLLL